MRSPELVEFTGERVVPGQVNDDLWSEHLARYAFAQRYAAGQRVLDCGCGAGYGSAVLAERAAAVTAFDLSFEAIDYASYSYAAPNTRFVAASCHDLPFPAESFDLVVAFEVVEHVADYRRFLDECRRVLTPGGLLVISTPNTVYYAETRAGAGPNPFHTHEFEAAEFRAELGVCFPQVDILLQNRVESFTFHSAAAFTQCEARIDGDGGAPADAHFFIALCSKGALPEFRPFVYVPEAANLLRERERHIRLLKDELQQTKTWLAEAQQDRNQLLNQYYRQLEAFDDQKKQLDTSNCWAGTLNEQLQAAQERIVELQREFAEEQQANLEIAANYDVKIRELEAENDRKTQWALELDQRYGAELDRVGKELAKCVQLLANAEQTVIDRTAWARRLEAQMAAIRLSRWMRIGRKLGVGPVLS